MSPHCAGIGCRRRPMTGDVMCGQCRIADLKRDIAERKSERQLLADRIQVLERGAASPSPCVDTGCRCACHRGGAR